MSLDYIYLLSTATVIQASATNEGVYQHFRCQEQFEIRLPAHCRHLVNSKFAIDNDTAIMNLAAVFCGAVVCGAKCAVSWR